MDVSQVEKLDACPEGTTLTASADRVRAHRPTERAGGSRAPDGERRNRTMALADELGRRITAGEWDTGATLPTEGEIQSAYGISRTVVREAIKHLAAKNMLAVGPKVGTRVRPITDWNMLDADVLQWRLTMGVDRSFVESLYEMRIINEPEAARLAAARIMPAQSDALAAALWTMQRHPRGSPDLIAADLAFHRIILEATGNPILRSLGTVIERSLAISFTLGWRQNPQTETVEQHARVQEAIARGDGDAAALFMRQLIESACIDVLASLRANAGRATANAGAWPDARAAVPFARQNRTSADSHS